MSKKIEKSAKELLAEGKLLRIQISFTDDECDIYNYLQEKPKMAKFVKGLIRHAMILEKTGGNPSLLSQELIVYSNNFAFNTNNNNSLVEGAVKYEEIKPCFFYVNEDVDEEENARLLEEMGLLNAF